MMLTNRKKKIHNKYLFLKKSCKNFKKKNRKIKIPLNNNKNNQRATINIWFSSIKNFKQLFVKICMMSNRKKSDNMEKFNDLQ